MNGKIRINRIRLLSFFYATTFLSSIGYAQAQEGPSIRDDRADITALSYLDNTTFATGYRYQGAVVAGLSGIDFDPQTGGFTTFRDNSMPGAWPRHSDLPTIYTLAPTAISATGGYKLNFTGVTSLAPPGSSGEPVMDTLESVRRDPNGDGLWFTSEGRGSVYHWHQDGSRHEYKLPAIVTRNSGNAGLEGLTFTPSGDLWVGREGTMDGDPSGISRLTQIDRTGNVLRQVAYKRDTIGNNGISEILALGDTTMLVMERAWDGTSATASPNGVSHNSIRIYRIDLAGATDIHALDAIPKDGSVKTVAKTLVFDSSSLRSVLDTYETKVDNLEGMTFGPTLADGHASVVLVSDNNNSKSQGKSQFIVFKVNSPVPAIQYWDGGPMADGKVGGSGIWKDDGMLENWARDGGWVNDPWGGKTAVFAGLPGTVAIDARNHPVSAAKLSFLTSGYRLDGDPLTLRDEGTEILVGDPASPGAAQTVATVAAPLTGAGGLSKTGAGILDLAGNSDYRGVTTVSGGTLRVSGGVTGDVTATGAGLVVDVPGSVGGLVTVGGGAGLRGTGTIGRGRIADGGILSPGGAGVGRLTVSGDLTFDSGSRYAVDFDRTGQADLVKASTISIANGVNVALSAQPGADTAENAGLGPKHFTILTSSNGVTGTFAGVLDDLAFFTAYLTYDAKDVYLDLDPNSKFVSPQDYTRQMVGQYNSLRKDHPDIVALNLQKVRETMDAAPAWRKSLARSDDTNFNMAGIADRARGGLQVSSLGGIGGENGNPFMHAGDNSPAALVGLGKSLSHSPRPCTVPISQGGVRSLVGCSDSSSFPSGHTANGTGSMLLMSTIFPERFQPFINRAQEYGENRIVAGMHYPLDVMASRAISYKAVADLLAKQTADPQSWLNTVANPARLRQQQSSRYCGGKTIADCASSRTDSFSVDTQDDYQRNLAYYNSTKSYGFPIIGDTNQPMLVPTNAEYLIRTRYPYLSVPQLREIIRTTADPSGAVLDDPWSRINLFKAAEGYGSFANDVTVDMDASLAADDSKPGAGFNAADRWRNDISGPGRLIKTGTGSLTLGGTNTFSGFELDGGGLTFTGQNDLTGSSLVQSGQVAVKGGRLHTEANFSVAPTGGLTLTDAELGSGGAMAIDGPVTVSGAVKLDLSSLSSTGRIAGNMSGSGLLAKTGTGDLTLSGINSYTGGTSVLDGTLSVDGQVVGMTTVGSGATLGGSGATGNLEISGGGHVAPGHSIGTLTVNGDAHFATGSNYDVEVNAQGQSDLLSATGKVRIDDGVAVNIGPADKTEDGSSYAVSTKYTILSGKGGVDGAFASVKDSFAFLTPTLAYDGANVFLTLQRSTTGGGGNPGGGNPGGGNPGGGNPGGGNPNGGDRISVGSPADLGTGMVNLNSKTLVSTASMTLPNTFDLGAATGTFDTAGGTMLDVSGAISGAGALVKDGAGKLKLDGNSAFSGSTDVREGILSVNGTLPGDVVVQRGGVLGGSGTIGSASVQAGGTLAPGNSIGTLTASGDVRFADGSIYDVEVDSTGRSDRVNAGGKITIGQNVNLKVGPENKSEDGSTYKTSTRYTIATATAGVSGQFAAVDNAFSFLSPTLSYDPGAVSLTLDRTNNGNILHFADFVTTPNQKATANAVEALGAGNTVFDAVLYLPDGAPAPVFDSLSGTIHPAVTSALFDDAHHVGQLLQQPLDGMFGAPGAGSAASGVRFATSSDGALSAWMSGQGFRDEIDGRSGYPGTKVSGGGIFLGGDAAVSDDWRLGMMFGYSNNSVSTNGNAADASIDGYDLGIYGGTSEGPAKLSFGAIYTWNDIDTNRSIAFPRFAEKLDGHYGASALQSFATASWHFDLASLELEPFARLGYTHLDMQGFRESGGDAALSSASQSQDQFDTTLGARVNHEFELGETTAAVTASAGWRHVFDRFDGSQDVSFHGGDAFRVGVAPAPADTALVGVGVDLALTKSANLSLRYDGEFGQGFRQQAINLDLGARF